MTVESYPKSLPEELGLERELHDWQEDCMTSSVVPTTVQRVSRRGGDA